MKCAKLCKQRQGTKASDYIGGVSRTLGHNFQTRAQIFGIEVYPRYKSQAENDFVLALAKNNITVADQWIFLGASDADVEGN